VVKYEVKPNWTHDCDASEKQLEMKSNCVQRSDASEGIIDLTVLAATGVAPKVLHRQKKACVEISLEASRKKAADALAGSSKLAERQDKLDVKIEKMHACMHS
jgi:hypothetical protein